MAKKLRDIYDIAFAELFADKLALAGSDFDRIGFLSDMRDTLKDESFLQRQDLYVRAIERNLRLDYGEAIRFFTGILGPELQQETGMFIEGFWLWPVARYVEHHGKEDFSLTMGFIHELTKRHTGEFAVRPLLIAEPRRTMTELNRWSRSENVHVRRLASEGMRISLPWAAKTTAAIQEFDLFEATLNNLKDDPSKFVGKSVGNNLNDLYKHDAGAANRVIAAWQEQPLTQAAQWIIRHGQRNLK